MYIFQFLIEKPINMSTHRTKRRTKTENIAFPSVQNMKFNFVDIASSGGITFLSHFPGSINPERMENQE